MGYTIQSQIGDFQPTYGPVLVLATGPTIVAPADPNRVFLVFGNFSGANVLLSIDPQLSSSGGLYLLRWDGDSREIWWSRHNVLVTMPWYGLSLNGSATIHVAQSRYQPTPAPCPTV